MAKEEACGWCGEWFVKRGNHNYCSEECSKLGKRQKERLRRKGANAKTTAKSTPSISNEGMVDLMMKLSKERGRVVQYGEVQSELILGKLKVKGGAVK